MTNLSNIQNSIKEINELIGEFEKEKILYLMINEKLLIF